MIKLILKACAVLLTFTLFGATVGCGGKGGTTAAAATSTATVTGLDTPASVSVVNAN